MAGPTDFQKREADKVEKQCSRYLMEAEEKQRHRWEVLHRIAELAGDQFSTMRLNLVGEGLRDQGPPLWFSCILSIGISLIPVSALTGAFLSSLTESTQQLIVARGQRRIQAAKVVARREQIVPRALAALDLSRRLPSEIKLAETMVADFAKAWEPELANIIQNAAVTLGDVVGGKQLFKQESGQKFSRQTDVPVVSVKNSLYGWIDIQVMAERKARKSIRDKIGDLWEIATSPEPANEAKAKEGAAREKEAKRETRAPFRRPVEKLPNTNQGALDELTNLRDSLEPTASASTEDFNAVDLRPLQLTIESMIWAMTYDFTPRFAREIGVSLRGTTVISPAPLPEGTWPKLTERYIDPDEGKSYAEVGAIDRLGTKDAPFFNPGGRYGPELRLSHYFSQILYPRINEENRKIVQNFGSLTVR